MAPVSSPAPIGPNAAFGTLYLPSATPPSGLLRLLWWCAGADGHLLERCPTDYIKYGNIGATVLLTSGLAFISMTYALNAVFDSLPAAVGMGVVWAVVIFVLDRSIVSTMRKPPSGSKFFSFAAWSEIPFLLVRLTVAVIIALTISKPLEVKIFEKRIAAQIDEEELLKGAIAKEAINKLAGVNTANDRLQQSSNDLSDLKLRSTQEPPTQDYQSLKIVLATQRYDYSATASTNNNIIQRNLGRMAGIRKRETTFEPDENGVVHRILSRSGRNAIGKISGENRRLSQDISVKRSLVSKTVARMDKISSDYQKALGKERDQLTKDQQDARIARDIADTAATKRQAKSQQVRKVAYDRQENGTYPLMTQISALGNLTDKDNSLHWASILITLLFLVIETAPILVKLFSKRGAYDDELELAEHHSWVRTQYEKSQVNSRINRKLDAISQVDERVRRTVEARQNKALETATKNIEQQQQIELVNNERLLKLIAKKQIQLAERLVEDWHKAELNKLTNPPTNQTNGSGTIP